jgi:hypothetical protein
MSLLLVGEHISTRPGLRRHGGADLQIKKRGHEAVAYSILKGSTSIPDSHSMTEPQQILKVPRMGGADA